ncbi:J domain-containing protein [Roseofilum sp. BLCC_M154]|uniref:J domain-containing protein n=1 Tax=Roseofilum acuticapitatum BLCC-M154 TaxID=3022444 RepID=A0ABT7ARH0_9CYAN|nr:J domain-containing protein [Roseofilum acuticapitatum]MDJ1169501.1 J domain-containing protein [Roseofilum acuticapitatum BLCC-M154]
MNHPSSSSSDQRQQTVSSTHYVRLGVHPLASALEIRRAYRELSKRYHPDTTELDPDVATQRFHDLNEAYAVLSNPERRGIYDRAMGYSRFYVVRPPVDLRSGNSPEEYRSSAYLDSTDRPLSAGELFALFILGLTFVLCLGLAIAIAWLHPELISPTLSLPPSP